MSDHLAVTFLVQVLALGGHRRPAWLTQEYEVLSQGSRTPASRAEKTLLAHIENTYPTVQVECALLVDGFDLDLYFPKVKLNVEVDGVEEVLCCLPRPPEEAKGTRTYGSMNPYKAHLARSYAAAAVLRGSRAARSTYEAQKGLSRLTSMPKGMTPCVMVERCDVSLPLGQHVPRSMGSVQTY
ncbi:hypothetical protein CYMTET_19933 [Cymbomonas tetramitiformis]|uniref:Uncharacterized protein n=1 Tax=Cymbomonas tetramitiformis TaxID=36881 RepID=A0AAE0G507_9CHLO|nr:hypothetical protein CYMTET_19933 [Cymbomonas tetramitiformis]